jgi:penicillin-binding protein 1C
MCGSVALFAAIVMAALVVWTMLPLPPHLLDRDQEPAVTIADRHGIALRTTRASDGSRAHWVAYRDIDPDLINAFVAVEDRRFWEHGGIDLRALARAVRDNVLHRRVTSGASTITMQLARILHPSDRDWPGKFSQALWALRLERQLNKQDILEHYLNRVHLGQATVGVASASALYFGAPADRLSLGQAATLAGLAHSPARDNPFASSSRARARRHVALQRMQRLGYATADEATRAETEPLVIDARSGPFLAPHFTSQVLGWIERDTTTNTIGMLRTSLDLPLQESVESEVRHTVDVLRDRGVTQAAVVVLDNASGAVLAWVGSPDFFSAVDGQTDMVTSPRQPGSALKPFLYALAIERGYTPATVLPDIPKSFATATGAYHPRNYDRRFRGPVRMREALASSYNVPAVELAARLGTGSLLNTLRLAGFESLRRDAEYYGLGLALGNGDVSLVELANGYRALANGGEWTPWRWRAGDAERSDERRRVMSPVASALVLDMLSDAAARIPGFGTLTPFDFPFPVAVKTGTSRHFTDNWAVGTTRGFTVAVWAGNFSGRPMEGVSGVTGAGPLLHRVVMAAAKRWDPGSLITPAEAGAVIAPVCRLSGMRATPNCASLDEWFVKGTEPTTPDTWERDGVTHLPDEYAEWSRQYASTPTPERVAHGAAEADSSRVTGLRITSPAEGDRYWVPVGEEARYATIALRAVGATDVRWTVDGHEHAESRLMLVPGDHVIAAIADNGERADVRIRVERQ